MTTIATDGKTVAFDSLVTTSSSFLMHADHQKAFEIAPGIIAAASGNGDDCALFIQWAESYVAGKKAEKPKFEDAFSGIVVDTNKGTCVYFRQPLIPSMVQLPFAIGNGGDMALGAMLVGASPTDAVRAAATRDLSTGGIVRELPMVAT